MKAKSEQILELHECTRKKNFREKHNFIYYCVIVSMSAGHNDEIAKKSLLCVKEGSMKWKARARFIGIMGLLLLFHFNFTCACNLCHTIIWFNLKDNKPIPYFVVANGLGCERTSHDPLSEVRPVCCCFTNTGQSLGWVPHSHCWWSHERKHISDFKLGEGKCRHIQNEDSLTHYQCHWSQLHCPKK